MINGAGTASTTEGLTANEIKDEVIKHLKKPVSLLDKAKLDLTKKVEAPPVALHVNDETFGTLGNFSLIIGKAKSKKTFLVALLMAGAIVGRKTAGLFSGALPHNKRKVVFIDTEQSEFHVMQIAKRVLNLSGLRNPDNFEVYALRQFDTQERNLIIEQIIETTPDLGILVIDGVRDIITSINDEEQATGLANKLLKWTEQQQIHIVTVLHQNKGDFNARGHVGTELINKAEITVSVTVEKDNRISKVQPEYCRHKEFEPFGIWVNAHGLPEKVEGWNPKSENTTAKVIPDEVHEFKHHQILQEVEKNVQDDKPKHSDMVIQLKLAVGKHLEPIGDTKAKEFLTHYLNKGLIRKVGKDRSPKSYYKIQSFSNEK